jgi:hypothetical protein
MVARPEELRKELATEPKKPTPTKPASELEERRRRLERERNRYLEAFADERMTREELRSMMARLDAERLRLDGEEQGRSQHSPSRYDRVAPFRVAEGGAIRAKATAERRRVIVDKFAQARISERKPCAFVWRSPEELNQRSRSSNFARTPSPPPLPRKRGRGAKRRSA